MQGLAETYLRALLATDRRGVDRATDAALASGLAPLDVYEDVFGVALYAVGERWAANEISVTTEHIATALTEAEMTRMLPRLLSPVRTGRVALVASVEGEQHRVGARMVADCFEAHGWDAHFTGASTAIDRLLADVAQVQPDVVALSMTVSMNVGTLRRTVEALAAVAPDTPVLVGGQGLRGVDHRGLVAVHPTLRVVATLRELGALVDRLHPSGAAPLPPAGAPTGQALVDPGPSPAWTPFLAEIAALPPVAPAFAGAFEAAGPVLIATVDALLEARPDLGALVGTSGLQTMRTNHVHHHRFVAGWLQQGTPVGLMATLVWVLGAYRTHGFALDYWGHELEAWMVAMSQHLTPAAAAALRPLYLWMLDAVPRIAALPT